MSLDKATHKVKKALEVLSREDEFTSYHVNWAKGLLEGALKDLDEVAHYRNARQIERVFCARKHIREALFYLEGRYGAESIPVKR